MTLIYPLCDSSPPPDSSQARTHFLIIGVGSYSYLPGGTTPSNDLRIRTSGLGQVSSPPLSADAFAQWAVNEFHNPDAPLGTVRLLISASQPACFTYQDAKTVEIERATWKNVQDAARKWYQACHEHEDNIAVFYFCGHGISVRGERFLLLEDFGQEPNDLFRNALYLERSVRLLDRCKANLQCFFIDACRNTPLSLDDEDLSHASAVLILPPQSDRITPRESPIFNAAARDAPAYANTKQVTFFTTALLEALKGRASRKGGTLPIRWEVPVSRLVETIHQLMDNQPIGQGQTLTCTISGEWTGTRTFHVCRQIPTVPVRLCAKPPHAFGNVQLEFTTFEHKLPINDPNQHFERPQGYIKMDLPAGTYMLKAEFPSHCFEPITMLLAVLPPDCQEVIECKVRQ